MLLPPKKEREERENEMNKRARIVVFCHFFSYIAVGSVQLGKEEIKKRIVSHFALHFQIKNRENKKEKGSTIETGNPLTFLALPLFEKGPEMKEKEEIKETIHGISILH